MRCAKLSARGTRSSVLAFPEFGEDERSCTGEFQVQARPQAAAPVCRDWAVSAPLILIPLASKSRCEQHELPASVPEPPKPYVPRPYQPSVTKGQQACGAFTQRELSSGLGSHHASPGAANTGADLGAAPAQQDWAPDGLWVRFLVWWETCVAPRLPLRR